MKIISSQLKALDIKSRIKAIILLAEGAPIDSKVVRREIMVIEVSTVQGVAKKVIKISPYLVETRVKAI